MKLVSCVLLFLVMSCSHVAKKECGGFAGVSCDDGYKCSRDEAVMDSLGVCEKK